MSGGDDDDSIKKMFGKEKKFWLIRIVKTQN